MGKWTVLGKKMGPILYQKLKKFLAAFTVRNKI